MNKKHFFYKGLALIILVLAELDPAYHYVGVTNPTTHAILKICLIAVAIYLAFAFDLRHRRRVTRNMLEVISDKLFRNTREDGVYRTTCYKYATPLQCLIWYRPRNFLMVIFRRERDKKRKMDKWFKGYLICYERFTLRSGTKRNYKSSISFLIDDRNNTYKGFAGKVYASHNKREIAVNVGKAVNEAVKKLKANDVVVSAFENEKYRDANVPESIDKLKSSNLNNSLLTDQEIETLEKFMSVTNTNLFQLMTIHNGIHATHFLGFKVYRTLDDYREKRQAWGVVTIDALDPRDFPECCLKAENVVGNSAAEFGPWIDFVLENFTAIFPSMTGE
jgi:hypothetical protein